MNNRVKNIIYTSILLSAMFLLWKYRQSSETTKPSRLLHLTGNTMGTTYNIKYADEGGRNFKQGIDSLLEVFNRSLNHYLKESEISRFNRGTSFAFELPYFYPVLQESKTIFELTDGAFDPTVMPLVNAWGFGPDKNTSPDSLTIDSLKQIVGFDKLVLNKREVRKEDERVQLDFGAIAKGYGIDVVADFLREKDKKDFYIEIGGEVLCGGKNPQSKQPWRVGIIDPGSDILNRYLKAKVILRDEAMATSANNFNYKIVDGVKYSHTLSPETGYPIKHALLSASVFAPSCMTADAMATAFMTMGHEAAIELLSSIPDIDAYLVYSDGYGGIETYATKGLDGRIEEVN